MFHLLLGLLVTIAASVYGMPVQVNNTACAADNFMSPKGA